MDKKSEKVQKSKPRGYCFLDHLVRLGILNTEYVPIPGKEELHSEYLRRWKDNSIYKLSASVKPETIYSSFGATFNDLASCANFVDLEGVIKKDREMAYNRMWLVYQILFDTQDKNRPHYLPGGITAKIFIQKYGFSPVGNKRSFADYLVDLDILTTEYTVVSDQQEKYDMYLQIWRDQEDYCIYEVISKRVYYTFLDRLEDAEDEFRSMVKTFDE